MREKEDRTMDAPSQLVSLFLDMDYVWNDQEKVWFIGQKFKYLFCANLETRELDIVQKIPEKFVKRVRDFIQVLKYKRKLICLPSLVRDILIYDIENQCVRTIRLKGFDTIDQLWCKSAGFLNDKLYIVERSTGSIIILDLKMEKIELSIDIECLDIDDVVGEQSILYRENIYIPVTTKQKVISFNINTNEFNEYLIDGDICGCRSICCDGKNFWIIGEHYGIVKWDPITQKVYELRDIPKDFKIFSIDWKHKVANWYSYSEKRIINTENNYFCWECLCDGKYVWVIPALSDSIIRINTNTMQVNLIQFKSEYLQNHLEFKRDAHEFSVWGVDSSHNLRIVSRQKYKIYAINTEKLSVRIEKWNLSGKIINLLIKELLGKEKWEQKLYNVEAFLYSELKDFLKEKKGSMPEEVGTTIYKSCNNIL